MGLLSLLIPQSWKRAKAEQVVWHGGWPHSSPTRTLAEFWLCDPIAIKPTRLPLGTLAKRVTPCVDVQFHFDAGEIVIDRATVCQKVSPNCSSIQGEAFDAVWNFFDRGVLEAVLQQQASTKKSDIRSCIYRVMAQERQAAGLEIPRRGRRG